MYQLAKLGFTQSYTYFTWRNTKAELQSYFEELANDPPKDFFRPNLFVNTPDINPYYLQSSGRPGFPGARLPSPPRSAGCGASIPASSCSRASRSRARRSTRTRRSSRSSRATGPCPATSSRTSRGSTASDARTRRCTRTPTRASTAPTTTRSSYWGKPSRNGDDMILVMVKPQSARGERLRFRGAAVGVRPARPRSRRRRRPDRRPGFRLARKRCSISVSTRSNIPSSSGESVRTRGP